MKTISQVRLECLRLAVTIAATKQVNYEHVIPLAAKFYNWVDSNDTDDVGQLYSKYAKKQVDR